MNDIKEKYLEAKMIVNVALDSDHPSNRFVRENITVEQMGKLQEMIRSLEDQGVHLVSREAN